MKTFAIILALCAILVHSSAVKEDERAIMLDLYSRYGLEPSPASNELLMAKMDISKPSTFEVVKEKIGASNEEHYIVQSLKQKLNLALDKDYTTRQLREVVELREDLPEKGFFLRAREFIGMGGQESLKYRVREFFAETASSINEGIETTKDNVKAGAEFVKEKACDAAECVADAAKSSKDYVAGQASQVKENVKEEVSRFQENLQNVADNAKANAEAVAGKATEIKDNIAGAARDLANQARDNAQQMAENAQGKVHEIAQQVRDSVNSKIEQVESKKEELKANLKENVQTVSNYASEVKDSISQKVSAQVEQVQGKVSEIKGDLNENVEAASNYAKDVKEAGISSIQSESQVGNEALDVNVHPMRETVHDLPTNTLKQKSPSLVKAIKNQVSEVAGEIKERIVGRVERNKEQVKETLENSVGHISKMARDVEDVADNVVEGLKDRVSGISSGIKSSVGIIPNRGVKEQVEENFFENYDNQERSLIDNLASRIQAKATRGQELLEKIADHYKSHKDSSLHLNKDESSVLSKISNQIELLKKRSSEPLTNENEYVISNEGNFRDTKPLNEKEDIKEFVKESRRHKGNYNNVNQA